MTTLERFKGLDEILRKLSAISLRRKFIALLTGLLAVAAIGIGSIIVNGLALGYWPDQPPAGLRWVLLIATALLWIAAIAWFLVRNAARRLNPAQSARLVEQAMPQTRNNLINSILLSRDRSQVSPELVQQAIHEATRETRRVDLNESISMTKLQRWGIAAAVGAVLLAGFGTFQGGPLTRGLMAMVPGSYVPLIGNIELLELQPGDKTIFAGETVTVFARIQNDQARDLSAMLVIDGVENPRTMVANTSRTVFTCSLPAVEETFRYKVRIGSSGWPREKEYYTVRVVKRVEVEGVDIRYDYPAYTGLKSRPVRNAEGSIEAPVNSRVTITLRLSAAVPTAILDIRDAAPEPMKQSADGKSFTTSFLVRTEGKYRMLLKDASGQTMQQLPDIANGDDAEDVFSAIGRTLMSGYYRIHPLPDAPPTIQFVAPNRDVSVAPGGTLETKIKVFDKYGLNGATFHSGRENRQRAVQPPIHNYQLNGAREGVFDYTLRIGKQYKEGDVIVYYATVTDNRDLPGIAGPQETKSATFKVMVQDAAKLAAEKAKRYEELRKRLMAILNMQLKQRVNTEICWKKHAKLAQLAATAEEITTVQTRIKAEMLDLVENFQFDAEMAMIEQALALLVKNDVQLAIDQAQVLAALKQFAARDKTCRLLAGTQDRIIDSLKTLLAVMPTLGKKADEKKAGRAGDDLPPEVKEKLAQLKKDLEKFIEAQKKIIQGSERLTKKPVDNFNAADEKLLEQLRSLQDKWEKFLNEKFTDFSKMAQQDFSNPQVCKELLSVKSDITMAKDALSKKAVEIATALEDNGIENAKTLTANIEKWLPDVPDREKWAMEDPTGQENIEAPELPKELEDLVGDLLEQEEDLFEEMEDLTSKYTLSGDKGIGWGAFEGPMPSMNAQGVTGNQLPNKSEMAGRSGEGRSGKSTGEFVEDKAVGKGGRRTPTRLSPDAFMKGQVKDVSKDPPGGATGGGKMSGSGAEGLEGPVPPPLAKELKRMAGKQAALLNRAERIRAKFKANDYANFKFLQAITLMSRVRSDLERYRYQNVLRTKDAALGAIRQTSLLLSGKIDVAADSSSAMPKYIRDDIADAMQGKLPAEYKDVLEQYYRRLGQQGRRQ